MQKKPTNLLSGNWLACIIEEHACKHITGFLIFLDSCLFERPKGCWVFLGVVFEGGVGVVWFLFLLTDVTLSYPAIPSHLSALLVE